MVFHSKQKTQIKGLWERRAKMTHRLEEEVEVTILRRLKICTLHLTLYRLLNQVWENNKLAQEGLKWCTVNTATNLQVIYNERRWPDGWLSTSQGIQNITEKGHIAWNHHQKLKNTHKMINGSTWWGSWLRRYGTSQKVVGSIPDGVIGIFRWLNSFGHITALGSTRTLTEISISNISWGVKAAGV
jgi:hypothetical protein